MVDDEDNNGKRRSIILPDSGQKTIMVRQSGHMTEQILISNKDAISILEENKDKLNNNVFDKFNKNNKAKIIKETFEIEDIGYRLTAPEYKLITAIRTLLYDKSDKNIDSELYYMGNYFPNGKLATTEFGGQIVTVPYLLVSRSDFYKAYQAKDRYSGPEQNSIDKLLREFTQKYFLTVYKQHVVINGKPKINRITEYRPLIKLKRLDKGLSEMEDNLLDQGVDCTSGKGDYLLSINPIWVDQIKTKWVEYPHNLNARIKIAVGSWKKFTPAIMYFINYLFHQRSNKNFITEINEDNLFIKLGYDKHVDPKIRHGKRANSYLKEVIRISIEIGLCKEARLVRGAQGQRKWIFEINDTIYDLV